MYLPLELPRAKVLVTVKTYPNPSLKYKELVCNAGFLESGEWIRIYPVQFRARPYAQQYRKYDWIELDLVRKQGDLRRESYMPRLGVDGSITTSGSIDTGRNHDWAERKRFALNEVFTSMRELIALSKTENNWKSLATVKPRELIQFEIEEAERDWDPRFRDDLRRLNLFETGPDAANQRGPEVVRKVPYRYYYHFLTDGDERPRRMMIEDWEIGALYWRCLADCEGDEDEANEKVRQKYENEFFAKDLYLFVGTSLANHIRAANPFMIIGVFYPPRPVPKLQLPLLPNF
jgi:hypothetical protein